MNHIWQNNFPRLSPSRNMVLWNLLLKAVFHFCYFEAVKGRVLLLPMTFFFSMFNYPEISSARLVHILISVSGKVSARIYSLPSHNAHHLEAKIQCNLSSLRKFPSPFFTGSTSVSILVLRTLMGLSQVQPQVFHLFFLSVSLTFLLLTIQL